MLRTVSLLVILLVPTWVKGQTNPPRVEVQPSSVKLTGLHAGINLLVTESSVSGESSDCTSDADYRSEDENIAKVDARGRIVAVADGQTRVHVKVRQRTFAVPVRIEGTTQAIRWHFENHILPILSRHGCNSSGCHGKAEGQNGFKLSVFGFDPVADHASLTREARGRRVFLPAAEHSLLLRKATGQMPHGGGAKLKPETADYHILRDWIAAGAPLGEKKGPAVLSVRVEPATRTMRPASRQQLRVWANWSDGRVEDVTHHARFQSNNDALALVDPLGLVQVLDLPGEATLMASYHGQTAIFRAMLPRAQKIERYPEIPANNILDGHVWARLRRLHILPSGLCDDATFLRRASLDIIGTLPTPAEMERFLTDAHPDRRARLVDALLERPEYADYWALKWADLLRVDRQALGVKQAHAFHRWIRASVARNLPLDEFARALVTAEGPLNEVPEAAFYKAVRKSGDAASHLSQVFLGVRIACAECHHHPYDRWTQSDFVGMRTFFAGVRFENSPGAEAVIGGTTGPGKHPRSGESVLAHALGESEPMEGDTGDPRRRLAVWMTGRENPYFARNLANRLWAHFLGRGLVEPVDDVRATNPPSNPELLDALAEALIESRFDAKAVIRLIATSRVYQLSTSPNETNESDEQNHSRGLLRRVPAEVLLDMVCQATGVPETFAGLPRGSRAIHLWDSKANHYFLKTFGRPARMTACECERSGEPGVAQVLHLLNAPELQAKLTHPAGTVARLVRTHTEDGPLLDELYRTFYSRLPTERERKVALAHLHQRREHRREAVEDLAWSLLNSLEFVFNH